MKNRSGLFRRVLYIAVGALVLLVPGNTHLWADDPEASAECQRLQALHVEKQANPNAARLTLICNGAIAPQFPAISTMSIDETTPAAKVLAGTDINLITGDETFPAVTQAGSMVWSSGSDIVVVYNDTKGAPSSHSGMSVSTDDGITFDRLDPDPFGTVFAGDFGSPSIAHDDFGASWLALALTGACGGQGIGLMSSTNPSDPASWSLGSCVHSGTADDRPIVWVDNNSGSSFYGRVYISFNDFSAGGALKVMYLSAPDTWTEVVVDADFTRNVHITGSSEADGSVFIFGMDEGGGADNNRVNYVFRSTDGGVNWTRFSPGPGFSPPGSGLCSSSDYFYMMPPVWRHMGWGQGAIGPGGVVHYVFCREGQVPGDLGDIYYIRSPDNGASWSTPTPLNTDESFNNNVAQWMPSISVTSQGYVLATWYDLRNTTDGLTYEYYGRVSLDNGETFLPDEPLSDVPIPQPVQVDSNTDFCFAGDSNFHNTSGNASLITWTDGRNVISEVEQMDVYFKQVPLCPAIGVSPTVLPNGELNQPYDETMAGENGNGPYTFGLSGVLPSGLTLEGSSGAITGSPTELGIFPFTIVTTDALSCQGLHPYSLIVDSLGCPLISVGPTTLTVAYQGAPYTETITATGGVAPHTFAVTAGALPLGLSLDSESGEISGAPVESGDYDLIITATDSNGCTGGASYTLAVLCPSITLSPEGFLPQAYAGVPYLANITANGGTAPYKYEVVTGTLHTGIFIGEGGTIFGVTEGGGNKNFGVQANDVNGCSGSKTFRLTSNACFPGAILCDSFSEGFVNFTATDQCSFYAAWYSTNACSSSGAIGHTPASHAHWGRYTNCTDYGNGATQDRLDSAPLDVSNCNSGEVTLSFNYLLGFEEDSTNDRIRVEVIADGGAVEVVADNGPGGPTCAGAASPGIGNLKTWSGWQNLTLTLPATSTFQVGFVAETDNGLKNNGESILIDDVIVQCKCPDDFIAEPDVLPDTRVGELYSVTIVPSGGAPPYTFDTLPGNPVPAGLALDNLTGVLSGYPSSSGTFSFTVVVTDSNFCVLYMVYDLVVEPVSCGEVTVSPASLPVGDEGTFYSEVVTGGGGTEPYTYAITGGLLPPGLSLNTETGVISGTPTTPEVYNFTITATEFWNCTGSQEYTIVIRPIGCPPITFDPLVLPNGATGVAYEETLTASGGVSPYLWFITAGALPTGLQLGQETGVISGTPTAGGTFVFDVVVRDADICYGLINYTVLIVGLPALIFEDDFETGDTSAWSSAVGL